MNHLSGIPDHIEDVLVKLHPGQWFGWMDSDNKVYANLVIHSSDYEKPTEKSLTDALAERIASYPLQELRSERNALLASTDWRDLPSYAGTKQAEWRVYRQALRDITVGLDTADKVTAATFPTQPS